MHQLITLAQIKSSNMRKLTLLLLLAFVIVAGCKQLNRFHEKELTLEVSYINNLLDEVSGAIENGNMDALSKHFVRDSSLVWSLPGITPGNSGWNGFTRNLDIHFRTQDDQQRKMTNRLINIDDLGNVAWFMETNDISFTKADSVHQYRGAVTSGVLTRLGTQWRIVQWNESY